MILITGGSGFIGQHVIRKAVEYKHEVAILTRRQAYTPIAGETVIVGDLENPKQLYKKCINLNIDKCIHMAWEGIPDYSYQNSKKSILDSFNLLETVAQLGVKKLIVTGSCWEYFHPEGSIKTDSKLDYSNYFKAAKQSVRMMFHAFCEEKGIKLNWLRLFYVYGPGQRKKSLIPYIIDKLKNDEPLILNGAYNKNDFVYVDDVAEAILHVLDGDYPETLNVGSGRSTRVIDIAQSIGQHFNKKVDLKKYAYNGNESNFYADAEEMKDSYGWTAKTSIDDGLEAMIAEGHNCNNLTLPKYERCNY